MSWPWNWPFRMCARLSEIYKHGIEFLHFIGFLCKVNWQNNGECNTLGERANISFPFAKTVAAKIFWQLYIGHDRLCFLQISIGQFSHVTKCHVTWIRNEVPQSTEVLWNWLLSWVVKKTCHLGFRPGPTQTELYNHRKWLVISNLRSRGWDSMCYRILHRVMVKHLVHYTRGHEFEPRLPQSFGVDFKVRSCLCMILTVDGM